MGADDRRQTSTVFAALRVSWKHPPRGTSLLCCNSLWAYPEPSRDGRLVGEVRLADGRNLSQELVKAGLAWHDGQYAPQDTVLQQLQVEAQVAKRGLWSAPQPVPPWAFRREEGAR